jgi:hypothetical protein
MKCGVEKVQAFACAVRRAPAGTLNEVTEDKKPREGVTEISGAKAGATSFAATWTSEAGQPGACFSGKDGSLLSGCTGSIIANMRGECPAV